MSTITKRYLDHWSGWLRVPGVDFRARMRGRPDPNALPKSVSTGGRGGRAAPIPNSFSLTVWQLKEGQDKIIADRLVEIFSAVIVPGAKSSS